MIFTLFRNKFRVFKLLLVSLFHFSLLSAGFSIAEPVSAGYDKAVSAVLSGNKARARAIMLRRNLWSHFHAIDSNDDWRLTFPEMNLYFMAMHVAFDVNSDGIVTVKEAPRIMLRYTVSGQPFPPSGLSRLALRQRLYHLFRNLDKDKNRILSIGELT